MPAPTILTQYKRAETALAKAKAKELDLRKQLIAEMFPTHKDEGTETVEIGKQKISVTFKMNRTLSRETLQLTWPQMPQEVRDLIDFKPALKLKDYKAYDGDNKRMLDNCLTMKPGLASVKIGD